MRMARWNAFCPLEIGDIIKDAAGIVHEVTDIAAVHYARAGKVAFYIEFDYSGKYCPFELIEQAAKRMNQYI